MIYGMVVVRPLRGQATRCTRIYRMPECGRDLHQTPFSPFPSPFQTSESKRQVFNFFDRTSPIRCFFVNKVPIPYSTWVSTPRTDNLAARLLDSTRPDHVWLGRKQCEVAVSGDVLDGADSKVAICCYESVFSIAECLVV